MKYFAEVCKERSVTKAAEKLHISQPSVTVAMQELEAETGLNLFVRQGKRIEVTPEGEFLLAKVSAILHSVEQLNNDIGELVHTKNHIKLALPLQVGSILIPMIFEEFIPRNPEIRLEIVEQGGMDSLRMVEKEELDLAITIYEADFCSGLNYTRLFDSECCFCTSREHRLADRRSVEVADLMGEKFVMLQGGFFINRMVQQAFADAGCRLAVVLRSAQLHTVKNLVGKNLAATFLMREAVSDDSRIVAIPFADPLQIRAGIVTKQQRQIYSDVRKLIEFVREKFRQVEANP
jgi:DNA-binding transcriptional LysR family regulator